MLTITVHDRFSSETSTDWTSVRSPPQRVAERHRRRRRRAAKEKSQVSNGIMWASSERAFGSSHITNQRMPQRVESGRVAREATEERTDGQIEGSHLSSTKNATKELRCKEVMFDIILSYYLPHMTQLYPSNCIVQLFLPNMYFQKWWSGHSFCVGGRKSIFVHVWLSVLHA